MKIYLAGTEQTELEFVERGTIDNALLSFYYLKDQGHNRMPLMREKCKSIFVDSGAHSFFSEDEEMKTASTHKKKTKTKETPDEFFSKFVAWLKVNIEYLDYYAELDIGELVGQKKVMKWRDILKKEGLYHKCVPVYHPKVMTLDDFDKMLDDAESRYVALEGVRNGKVAMNYKKIVKMCYDKGVKVHGFAMIRDQFLDKVPFTSTDSVSWKSGFMYGSAKVVSNNKFKTVALRNKDHMVKDGLSLMTYYDLESKKDQRFLILEKAIEAYKHKEDYYTKLWKMRGVDWNE